MPVSIAISNLLVGSWTSVCYQTARSTQPGHPSVGNKY